ncbi:MAG: hypothetical protein ACJAT1_000523 [Marivirga sp.]|jgi:hypothetical protein
MIQRIQSIFLLLVGLIMIIFLFAPIWQKQEETTGKAYTQTAIYVEKTADAQAEIAYVFIPFFIPGCLALIAACLALFSIGFYKKRIRQMLFSSINTFLIGGTLVLSAWWASSAETTVLTNEGGGYQFGLFLPALALFFNVLALRFIRKDERLVRSMDRLR